MEIINKVIKNKYLKTAVSLLLTCLLMYMSVRWILMQDGDHSWLQGIMVSKISYLISCGGLVFASLVIYLLKGRIRLEYLFLIMYIPLVTLYISVIPLSSTPDETEHMLRAYGISQGDLVPETNESGEGGSFVPSNINYMWNRGGTTLKDMRDNISMEAGVDRAFMTYSNTALYSPLTYAPQALGILTGRLICNKPYIWAYLGRMFNMLTVGILIFLAIRISPMGKEIIFALSMLPVNMYECASLSGGPLAYAVTVLLIAYVLWLKYEKTGEMDKREKLCLYLLLLFAASCKIVYAPFVLMAFAIPAERFGDKKKYRFHVTCAGVMVLLASVGWMTVSSRYLIEYNEGVDSAAQMKFVLFNLPGYCQIIINTFMQVGEWLIRTFFAGALGYFDVGGSLIMMTVSAANLIYVCVSDRLNVRTDEEGRNTFTLPMIMLFLSAFFATLGVLTSEYVQWTPYMNPSIDGLQGRYFLPVILPLVLLLKKKHIYDEGDKKNNRGGVIMTGITPYSKLMICFVNLMTIVTLFIHYA